MGRGLVGAAAERPANHHVVHGGSRRRLLGRRVHLVALRLRRLPRPGPCHAEAATVPTVLRP